MSHVRRVVWLPLVVFVTLAAACADNPSSLHVSSGQPADPSVATAPAAPVSPAIVGPPSPSPSPTAASTAGPSDVGVTVVERTLERMTDRLDVSIRYPQLQGLADHGIQDRINDAIRIDIEGHVPTPDPVPPQPLFQGRKYGVHGAYQVARLDGRVASILQSFTISPPTAAHPTTRQEAFNVDLTTGEAIPLRSLFKPETPWLETLSRESPALIIDDVQRRHGWVADERTLLKQGYAPVEKNFEVFTLPPEGLRVTFQEYQVGAYVLGWPTVLFPWDHLAFYLADTPQARHVAGQAG